jgi:glycosyltransferase involved in cell wall biosynthesis
MKVVHLAPSRSSESSAAWRLVDAQQKNGIDAFSLVYTNPNGHGTLSIFKSRLVNSSVLKVYRILNSAIKKIVYKSSVPDKLPWSIDIFGKNLARKIQSIQPDIIHLHWIPSMVDLDSFRKSDIPVVITLHDVWPLTGGCHCNLGCDNWKSGCIECPQVISRFPSIYSPRHQWEAQKTALSKISNLTVVCPSKWILEMAKASPKFVNSELMYIPNCVEKVDMLPAKTQNKDDVYHLVYVMSGERNSYHKGLDLLIEILSLIDKKMTDKAFCVSFIGGDVIELELSNISIRFIPFVSTSEQMLEYLHEADLLLLPSRQDNLPNVAIEANLVGTPVIAFNVGGIGDIVETGISGELVDDFNCLAFANKIVDAANGNLKFSSRHEVQKRTLDKFGSTEISRQYLEFYSRLVDIRNV